MALIRIKERWIYLNPKREKLLRAILLKDFDPLNRIGTRIGNSKARDEFENRIIEYLTKLWDESKKQFEDDWLLISLDDKEAKHQVTDILLDWCSLNKGFGLIDQRSYDLKFLDDRTGKNRLYPLGDSIMFSTSPAPGAQLLGYNSAFRVRVNCDEVESIFGEIDSGIMIELPTYSISLRENVEVFPPNCLIE